MQGRGAVEIWAYTSRRHDLGQVCGWSSFFKFLCNSIHQRHQGFRKPDAQTETEEISTLLLLILGLKGAGDS